MKEMTYRFMKEEDLDQVCKIENSIFSRAWEKSGFLSSLQNKNNIYMVAEKNLEIMGYCGLWGIVGEGHITNMAVKETVRGQGIGYQMLSGLIEEAKNQGITVFTLEVRKSNVQALNLYDKFKFRSVGVRKDFYEAPKEDGIIMWRP
jgi:[ribosomal protein S18]-alanine N-acetyltransferase